MNPSLDRYRLSVYQTDKKGDRLRLLLLIMFIITSAISPSFMASTVSTASSTDDLSSLLQLIPLNYTLPPCSYSSSSNIIRCLTPLIDTIPPVVYKSKTLGPADPNRVVILSFILADNLSCTPDPNHPMSNDEYYAKCGPPRNVVTGLINWLNTQGPMVLGQEWPDDIEARVTLGWAERVLHVQFNMYQCGDMKYFSNANDPLLPNDLIHSIVAVLGLENVSATQIFYIPLEPVGSNQTHQTHATDSCNP